jgi:GTP1/Obg family GTP-binding protein
MTPQDHVEAIVKLKNSYEIVAKRMGALFREHPNSLFVDDMEMEMFDILLEIEQHKVAAAKVIAGRIEDKLGCILKGSRPKGLEGRYDYHTAK